MKVATKIICVLSASHLCSFPSVKRLEDTRLMTDLWFVVGANLSLSVLMV